MSNTYGLFVSYDLLRNLSTQRHRAQGLRSQLKLSTRPDKNGGSQPRAIVSCLLPHLPFFMVGAGSRLLPSLLLLGRGKALLQ